MTARILTINAGSSSLKFALFELNGAGPVLQAKGQVETLDTAPHCILKSSTGEVIESKMLPKHATGEHEEALLHVVDVLKAHVPGINILAVGHRVVHGGQNYSEPLILTEDVIAELEEFVPLAPLHQPHNLAGIAAAHVVFPEAIQIACFDTAFHREVPSAEALQRFKVEREVIKARQESKAPAAAKKAQEAPPVSHAAPGAAPKNEAKNPSLGGALQSQQGPL